MKILLISPLLTPQRTPEVYNIGLGYIAASLLEDGHNVNVLDIQGHKYPPQKVIEEIKNTECDVIGIGTLITGYKYVEWLVREIRNLKPKVKIWIGNSVASPIPEIILNNMAIDVVVAGEGEITVKELAIATEKGEDLQKVKGIYFKQDGKIIKTPERELIPDIDAIPFPAWHLFPQEIYLKTRTGFMPSPRAFVITTRGCPYRCTYCYHPFQNQRVRFHSAERIIEEVKLLKSRYQVKSILFGDDLFTVNKMRVYRICDLLEKERLNIKWMSSSRVDSIDEDMLKRMKSAGCLCLGFGIESGSQTILDNIKKQTTVEKSKRAIQLCKKVGIHPACSFMIGNVGETRETVLETVSFVKEIDLEPPIGFFFATPYPGTELYDYAEKEGKIPDEISLFESYGEQSEELLVNVTKMSDDDLINLRKEAVGYSMEQLYAPSSD